MAVLAGGLRKTIPYLWRVSLRRLIPSGNQLEIAAVWSALETALTKGVRMSALATSFPEVVRTDRPVIFSVEAGSPQLLEQLLASEGIQSWVSIPLHRGDLVVAVLGLSSLEAGAFDPKDEGFYADLGASVEERLVELMALESD